MNLVLTHLAVAGISIALASVAIGLHLSVLRYRLEDRIFVLEDALRKLHRLDMIKPTGCGCFWKNEIARLINEPGNDCETACDESLKDSDNRSKDETVLTCPIPIRGHQ